MAIINSAKMDEADSAYGFTAASEIITNFIGSNTADIVIICNNDHIVFSTRKCLIKKNLSMPIFHIDQ